jgi:hypothetical protein
MGNTVNFLAEPSFIIPTFATFVFVAVQIYGGDTITNILPRIYTITTPLFVLHLNSGLSGECTQGPMSTGNGWVLLRFDFRFLNRLTTAAHFI